MQIWMKTMWKNLSIKKNMTMVTMVEFYGYRFQHCDIDGIVLL